MLIRTSESGLSCLYILQNKDAICRSAMFLTFYYELILQFFCLLFSFSFSYFYLKPTIHKKKKKKKRLDWAFFFSAAFPSFLIRGFYFLCFNVQMLLFNQKHLFVPIYFSYHGNKIGELYEMIDFRFKFFTYQFIYTFIYKFELSPISWSLLTVFCFLIYRYCFYSIQNWELCYSRLQII